MRVSDMMEGRNQGLVLALKIVKQGGVEALEDEIRYRNLTGVSLNVTRNEIRQASENANLRATEVAITFSLITLLDEFCFSKYQIEKFKAAFDSKVMTILSNDATLEKYLKRIKDELNIDLIIRD